MQFRRTPITGPLRQYAEAYWEIDAVHDTKLVETVPASGRIHLLFPGQPSRVWMEGKPYDLPASFVGQVLQPGTNSMEMYGHQHYIGITLSLLGMYWLFGLPPRLALNGLAPFTEATGMPIPPFARNRDVFPTYDLRCQAALAWLQRLACGHQQTPSHSERALMHIAAQQGAVRLRDALGSLSLRQLERTADDLLGTTPKYVSRLFRFNKALSLLSTQPHLQLLDIAAVCGFSDPAHVTREFRTLGGFMPTTWRNEPMLYTSKLLEGIT